ncbi:MAG: adenylosuccinate synthase [Flammeovirgaceae bacterium]|nr:adenylosuccinate synthase [Flammeovirgaceae bacterium]MDW8286620.1 adenylosuccinate synthase [Flammeovirgaceae bacterium]
MDVLLGLQWGDEGKGKVVDFLAPQYDIIARFQGGPNAGHTLEFDGKKFVLHQIPSGIFQPHTINLIGNGVVLDLSILQKEILKLEEAGYHPRKNLYISKTATLILPTHRLLDAAFEQQKGEQKIGSTLKGIGPTYQDKVGRLGLRAGDIFEPYFLEKYQEAKKRHLTILNQLNFSYDLDNLEKEFFEAVRFARDLQYVHNVYFLNEALQAGKKILAEGAQGSMLDVDFGSYPYVTSSNTFSAGASTGLGIAPNRIKKVFGIFKAYCTRVGSGPFPTELFDEKGEKIQQIGHEFGATTGRKRRCGWLDLPALRYAVMLNGVTELFMMKADVLNTFEEINICTHYELNDGTITDKVPCNLAHTSIRPVYVSMKGWNCTLPCNVPFDQLPRPFVDYVQFIEKNVGLPIKIISLGPDRTQTVVR